MKIFQKPYNFFRSWTTPTWLKLFFDALQGILKQELIAVSREMVNLLTVKIIELQRTTLTGPEKFKELVAYSKQLGITSKDVVLNAFLNALVLKVKMTF